MWDRSKQNYFIARRGNPWSVWTAHGDRKVCDFPAYFCDDNYSTKICFAKNDEEVIEIAMMVFGLPQVKAQASLLAIVNSKPLNVS